MKIQKIKVRLWQVTETCGSNVLGVTQHSSRAAARRFVRQLKAGMV